MVVFLSGTKRQVVEEFGGLFATDCWVQQVAVYSIFILKCAAVRLMDCKHGHGTC
jgi:hypothetical protein